VQHASASGLYVQLTTSGVGLDECRARRLADAGVQCVQLSVQDADAEQGDRVAGYRAHGRKQLAAAAVRAAGLPLAVNVVLHRLNLDRIDQIIELAAAWGAERLELANAQYYHWALRNRDLLLPSAEQLRLAREVVEARRNELGGRLRIAWVAADYFTGRPKPCMGGWGRVSMTVAPDGRALPCPAADTISTLLFDSVRDRPLRWLWEESPAFSAYRGSAWMVEPCRSCDRREIDFGGCRCQAFALTGDARQADPACSLSPAHQIVRHAHHAAARAVAADTDASRGLVHRREPSPTGGMKQ